MRKIIKTCWYRREKTLPWDTKKEESYNSNELRHIAVNYAVYCEKGYKGTFDDWLNKIARNNWRLIANRK